MTLRTRHGNARKYGVGPVVETPPLDELARGMPDPSKGAQAPRRRGRRFEAADPHTIAAARSGGRSRAGRSTLAHTLGVTSDDPEWRKLLGQAEQFRRQQVKELRDNVGGGKCGPAPAALVCAAALALAGSKRAYMKGDASLGSKLSEQVRQHLLGAHQLCALEAEARRKQPGAKTPTQQKLEAMRARAPRPPLTKPTENPHQ